MWISFSTLKLYPNSFISHWWLAWISLRSSLQHYCNNIIVRGIGFDTVEGAIIDMCEIVHGMLNGKEMRESKESLDVGFIGQG